jgi:hypothetical protein
MRVRAFIAVVPVSCAVLVSDGCARRHYRVNVTEAVPFAAHRPGAVKSHPPDARNGVPTAKPSNGRKPPSAPPTAGSVGTSGVQSPRAQGMLGSSDRAVVDPNASIAAVERPSESGSSSPPAAQSRPPNDGPQTSRTRWLRPVVVVGIGWAILLAVFALRWLRRDRTLVGH